MWNGEKSYGKSKNLYARWKQKKMKLYKDKPFINAIASMVYHRISILAWTEFAVKLIF